MDIGILKKMLLEEIDKNKMYYSDEMLAQEMGLFGIYILFSKDIITDSEFEELKQSFMAERNENMIEEALSYKNDSEFMEKFKKTVENEKKAEEIRAKNEQKLNELYKQRFGTDEL